MSTNKKLSGWLIVNGFLQTSKFNEIYKWIIESAKKHHMEMVIKYNHEMLSIVNTKAFINQALSQEKPDFVLFWDKDIRLAQFLEEKGFPVFNSSKAIETCDDKSLTAQKLAKAGLPMPLTILSPMSYRNIGYNHTEFLKNVEETLGLPYIMKACFGSFGAQVYLIENTVQAEEIMRKSHGEPYLFQQFIKCSMGRDIRINMVGDRAVASMLRFNENDFRANITAGATMIPYQPNEREIALAQAAMKALKLDFGGVDILFGKSNDRLVCEVNSNAHFKNIFDCTNINVADEIMEYIRKRIDK